MTHPYAPPPNAIIDDNGRLLPEVIAARKRGVLFDVGHGRLGHIRWDVAESAIRQGFPPDTFAKASHVLVAPGRVVFVLADGAHFRALALDAATGAVAWRAKL